VRAHLFALARALLVALALVAPALLAGRATLLFGRNWPQLSGLAPQLSAD
jgi:hypothetical protein